MKFSKGQTAARQYRDQGAAPKNLGWETPWPTAEDHDKHVAAVFKALGGKGFPFGQMRASHEP